MQRGAGLRRQGFKRVKIISDQICHRDIAMPAAISQRPICDGAYMLFKLINRAAILRPMPRIMNPWRDFIDD